MAAPAAAALPMTTSRHLYDMDELHSASIISARTGNVFNKGFVDVEADLSGRSEDAWRWNMQVLTDEIGLADHLLPLYFLIARMRWTDAISEYGANQQPKKTSMKQLKALSHVVPKARELLVAASVLVTRSPKSRLVASAMLPTMVKNDTFERLADVWQNIAPAVNEAIAVAPRVPSTWKPVAWLLDVADQPITAPGNLVRQDAGNVFALDPFRLGCLWLHLLRETSTLWAKTAAITKQQDDDVHKNAETGTAAAAPDNTTSSAASTIVAEAEASETLLLAATHLLMSIDLVERRVLPDEAARPTFAFMPLHQDQNLKKWQKYFPEIVENSDVSRKVARLAFWRRPIAWMWSTLLSQIPLPLAPSVLTVLSLLELLAQGIANERTIPILAVLLTARRDTLDWTRMTHVDLLALTREPEVARVLDLYSEYPATEALDVERLKQRRHLDLRSMVDKYCLRSGYTKADANTGFALMAYDSSTLHLDLAAHWPSEELLKSHGPVVVPGLSSAEVLHRHLTESLKIVQPATAVTAVVADRFADESAQLYETILADRGLFHARAAQILKWAYKSVWHTQCRTLFSPKPCPAKQQQTPQDDEPEEGDGTTAHPDGENDDDGRENRVNEDGDDESAPKNTKKKQPPQKKQAPAKGGAAAKKTAPSAKKAAATRKRKRASATDGADDNVEVDVKGAAADGAVDESGQQQQDAGESSSEVSAIKRAKTMVTVLRTVCGDNIHTLDATEVDNIMRLQLAQLPTSASKKFVLISPQYVYKGPFAEGVVGDIKTVLRSVFRTHVMRRIWASTAPATAGETTLPTTSASLVRETTVAYDADHGAFYLRTQNIATTDPAQWTGEVRELKTHDQLPVTIVDREKLGVQQVVKRMDDTAVSKCTVEILKNLMQRYLLGNGDAHLGNFILNDRGVVLAVDFEDEREKIPLLGQMEEPTLIDCLFSKKHSQKDMALVDRWLHQHADALHAHLSAITAAAKKEESNTAASPLSVATGLQEVAALASEHDIALSVATLQARVSTLHHCMTAYYVNNEK